MRRTKEQKDNLFNQIMGIVQFSKASTMTKDLHIQKAIRANNVRVFVMGFMVCLGIMSIIMLALG